MGETKPLIFTREATGLVREFGFLDVLIFVIATPAASGVLYFTVERAFDYPGASAALAHLLGGLLFIPVAICLGLMSASMPRSGGMYIAVSRVLGPHMGFLGLWLLILGYAIAVGVLGFIVTTMFGSFLITANVATGLGKALSTAEGGLIGGIIWTIFFWAVVLIGTRTTRLVIRVLFIIPLIATAIAFLWFVIVGPGGVVARFENVWGTGAFDKVINTARANEWEPEVFSWSSTITFMGIVVAWAWTAWEAVTFVGGEVRTPRRNLLYGVILGAIGVTILYSAISWSVMRTYGEFIAAYDFLRDNGLSEGVLGPGVDIRASVPFYFISLVGGGLGAIIAIGIALWFANSILPVFFACSRNFFALGFDRAFPEKLTDIDVRGVPAWSAHITGIIGIIGVLLTYFDIGAILAVLNFTMFFIFWLFGIAAMLFPYIRPAMYEASPVKYEIAGVPVVTITGAWTFCLGLFYVVLSSMFDFTIQSLIAVIALTLIGLLAFVWKYAKNVKEGVEIDTIYSQIPPE